MNLTTLKNLEPSKFADAADGYRAVSDMASAAKDRIANQISAAMRDTLEGKSASAALGQLQALAENFHYTQVECGLISTALNGFSYDLEAAKRRLDVALIGARAEKYTVNSDGSITYPAAGEKTDGKLPEGGTVSGYTDETAASVGRQAANFDPNPHRHLAQEYANQISTALKEATEADEKWGPKMRALKADDDLTVSDRDWADVSSDSSGVQAAGDNYLNSLPQPPKDGDPKAIADWWRYLTPEQQAAWISMRPDAVGALDGLPSEVRDEANRMVLAESHGVAQVEYQNWLIKNPEPSPRFQPYIDPTTGSVLEGVNVETREWKEWEEARQEAHKRLDGMDAIQDRFNQTGINGLPEAYLLGFNAEGNGRAILANGNPDTADHQAVYVPGTTSKLSSVEGDINRMVEVWRAADDKADGRSVSTVTWLGYDAPQSLVKDSPFEHYAYDGAPAFNRFLDGLETSHAGDSEAHRTVIAHSYGSTLVGAAAETGRLNADDVIFAGSPGVKVSHADEMDVPQGHVWNQEADGDPVPDIGRYGHGGDGWVVPSDEKFGANQMDTDTEGHSDYWDEGTDSLLNQALVVAGKGDDVEMKPSYDWSR